MTGEPEIEVRRGLPDELRDEAAAILWEAFREKFAPLIGSEPQSRPILAAAIDPDLTIGAYRDGKLVGLAGLSYGRRLFITLRLAPFLQVYGWFWGHVRYALARPFFVRPLGERELLLHSLAVAERARGMGVGTALLAAVEAYAREHGFEAVVLEVVNTNPGARRLYERNGYVEVASHLQPFGQLLGFTAYSNMRKRVTP